LAECHAGRGKGEERLFLSLFKNKEAGGATPSLYPRGVSKDRELQTRRPSSNSLNLK